MNRRSFLLEMRREGQLKGDKPCFVMVKYNDGNRSYRGEYIMSLRNDKFYFQKVNRLFEMLRPKDDFELKVKDFIGFKVKALNHRNAFMLYSNDDILSFEYMVGLRETFSTEENIERIGKVLVEKGLKRIEEEE
ncbi:MAG: hypothetical protein K6B64_04255 [Acholeplasmatales bacterium]|nr:hypothetical protein [Acholeplasmatales bacterium]